MDPQKPIMGALWRGGNLAKKGDLKIFLTKNSLKVRFQNPIKGVLVMKTVNLRDPEHINRGNHRHWVQALTQFVEGKWYQGAAAKHGCPIS